MSNLFHVQFNHTNHAKWIFYLPLPAQGLAKSVISSRDFFFNHSEPVSHLVKESNKNTALLQESNEKM